MKKPVVFDNLGASFDRFTIINSRNGDMFGASENPFHPCGFGQFVGNVKTDWKKPVKEMLEAYRSMPEWIGKEVNVAELPNDVQKFIAQL